MATPQVSRKHQLEDDVEYSASGAESASKKAKTDENSSPSTAEKDCAVGLLNMPNEILEMIIEKLPFQDIVKTRRICRKFHKMFPVFCTAPVVQYPVTSYAKVRGLARLQRIIKSVTHATTQMLTIQQPIDCQFVMNAAIARDLKKRCPSLKRLILKARTFGTVRVKDGAIRALPSSLQLELHHARLLDDKFGKRHFTYAHGIFQGPFNNWTVSYIRLKRQESGFGQPLAGYYECGDSSHDFDEQSDDEEDYYEEDDNGYEYDYGYDVPFFDSDDDEEGCCIM